MSDDRQDRGQAEDILRLRADLREAHRQLAAARKENDELRDELRFAEDAMRRAWHQLRLIRGSSSWRMTAPWRLFRG